MRQQHTSYRLEIKTAADFTPKNKTLELFGTRPDPSRKPAPDNVPKPFHVYSMRQAIEEKFILDVLQN
jgi:type I restriction enzyme R subunit